MSISDLIYISASALALNKVRAFLATLGIIIGIGSVIALLSLGQGSKQSIKQEVALLGANLLTITPGGVLQAPGSSKSLKIADSEAITNDTALKGMISNVSPELSQDTVVSGNRLSVSTTVLGVAPAYQQVHAVTMQQGAFITTRDGQMLAKSIVIGPQLAASLFGNTDPLGKTIHIQNTPFVVIGVTQSKGGNIAQSQDNLAFIPLRVAEYELFGQHYLSSISLSVKNSAQMIQAQNTIGFFLLSRHQISDPLKADFSILSQKDILSVASKTSQTLSSLLTGIAAISLIVGGIGIMNVMLMAVIERTREIGLKKALGATDREITQQILTETVALTFIGGLLGIVGGIMATLLISYFLHTVFVISVVAILIALLVSGCMGIIFGVYPALKASALSPIEALRYE